MKPIVAMYVILIAVCSLGANKTHVVRSPIKYSIKNVEFTQDEHEGEIIKRERGQDGINQNSGETIQEEKNANIIKKEVYAGSEVDGGFSLTPKGAIPSLSGKVNAGGRVSNAWTKEKYYGLRKKQIVSQTDIEKGIRMTEAKSGNWKLKVTVLLENITTNRTFVYDSEIGSNSGMFVKSIVKGHPLLIPLPLTKKLFKTPLRPKGGVTDIIEVEVTDKIAKGLLYQWRERGVLKESLMLEIDDAFCFKDKESKEQWCISSMSHLIVVNVDFAGNVASKFPVYIVGDRLFCTDVLDAVSSELEDNDKFVFKDKLLDKGLGFDFGKVTNDEENVYMIMAKLNDKLKPVLVGDAKLSSPYGNKTELLFTRISTDKLLSDYQKTPTDCLKPVASNFLTYIENAITTAPSTISIEDLRAGAELALAVGENAEKDGDQVESIREYTRYAHFLCCMDKESRDAYIQGNEQHVIESVIKGNCDKYFSGLYDLGWSNTNRTMLGYAAEKGALNIVKWLIEGCPEKYKTAVDELVPDGKKNSSGEAGKTPLYWAAKGGHLKVCQYLVSKGADVNRKFYDYKKASKKIEEIDELVDKNEITNEVRTYIKAERDLFKVRDRWWRWCGSVPSDATGEKIRQWIKAGVSPDSYLGRHWNLLSWAVALRDINLVTFLISYGADVKGKYSACPSDGYTALMLACEEGDTNLVKELIFKGVDLYVQQEDDLTAFHYAIKCKQYECAQMLLDNGLDVTNCPSVKIDGVLIDPQKFAEEFPTIKSLCANARQGDADSQNELGYYYSKGIGVYKDWGEAVKWFRKAAAQDHAVAHYNLYLCHSTGMGGVKKDKIEAEKHRKKAEELGYHTN